MPAKNQRHGLYTFEKKNFFFFSLWSVVPDISDKLYAPPQSFQRRCSSLYFPHSIFTCRYIYQSLQMRENKDIRERIVLTLFNNIYKQPIDSSLLIDWKTAFLLWKFSSKSQQTAQFCTSFIWIYSHFCVKIRVRVLKVVYEFKRAYLNYAALKISVDL